MLSNNTRTCALNWNGKNVGRVPVPDSLRPPMSPEEIKDFPLHLIIRSTSFLFQPRPGDFYLRECGREFEIHATHRLGSGASKALSRRQASGHQTSQPTLRQSSKQCGAKHERRNPPRSRLQRLHALLP